MTPERKKELERVMNAIIEREIKYSLGVHTAAETAQHLTDLSQIFVCISTAYDLLSGDVYDRLHRSMVAASTRGARVAAAAAADKRDDRDHEAQESLYPRNDEVGS
jgi:hypothetical protein